MLAPATVLAQPDPTPNRNRDPLRLPVIDEAQLKELIGPPTLVTFSGENVKVPVAVEALLATTPHPQDEDYSVINIGPKPPKSISVHWKDKPFWEAATELQNLTGWVDGSSIGGLTGLIPEPGWAENLNGLLTTKSPYARLIVTSIRNTVTRPLGESKKQQPNFAALDFSLFLDPKLPVLQTEMRDVVVQITPNSGLIHLATDWQGAPMGDIAKFNDFSLALPMGLKQGSSISWIKGNLGVDLVLAKDSFEIEDLMHDVSQPHRVGTTDLVLMSAEIVNNKLKAKFNLTREMKYRGQLNDNRIFGELKLQATKGYPKFPNSVNSVPTKRVGTRQSFEVEMEFDSPQKPGPFTLNWEIPTDSRSFEVPFELRDIAVP